jgi:Ferredoxin-like domain in Api92-like protein
MPNDCQNYLILKHSDRSKLEEALSAYERGELLSYFLPVPAAGDDTRWLRVDHWGTKWDIYHNTLGTLESDDNYLTLHFSTAWTPPLLAYDAAVERHGFQIEAYYNEFGEQFCGEYVPNEKDLYYEYREGEIHITEDLENIFDISMIMSGRDDENDFNYVQVDPSHAEALRGNNAVMVDNAKTDGGPHD